ncbi:MAG: YggS family pyridoxal phosphate-dependent enzyme [Clostridiales bacterium]|nr:YggS family pyridoxal phosphate-dependent enzyme [Clostridiales bacterium]MDY3746706.1 YggS family pyridoxal phosphate-dependent enzyme [Lachnospiraceae bacterium]
MIKENIAKVQENIKNACIKSGRDVSEVTLIAVSKTKPIEAIYEAMACGMKDFGENKVQEMCDKIETINEPLNWHLIGHLQTNKVKYIIGRTCLIHSVDSLHLAEKIQDEAAKKNVHADILVQVNVANETTKFGLSTDETIDMIEQIAKLPNVHIQGLMTIAPFVDDPEDNRQIFREMKQLSVDIKGKNIDNVDMNILSMGMTGDYEVAIEEGATMVRVGTGIFGERNYNR